MQETTGIKIKRLRFELGLTQKELASILKVNELTITYWETDRRQPSIKSCLKLIDFSKQKGIETSLNWLRGNG